MNMTIEELLSEYWDIAHSEGATGVSRGTEAQVVLTKLRAAIAHEEAKQPLPADRAALVVALRTGYSTQIQQVQAADMLAADAPFAPDWANYRQGVANGKAEALESIQDLQAVHDQVTIDTLNQRCVALQAELEKANMHIKHIGNDALRAELADCERSNEELKAMVIRYGAELDALKKQEPVAFRYQVGRRIFLETQRLDHYHISPATQEYVKGDPLYLAAGAQQVAVPQGWKLVPIEENAAMWTAGGRAIKACGGHERDAASLAWNAMLAAAPQPQGEAK